MSNCNSVKLIGRLCADTQQQGPQGGEWLTNTVAVRREYKNQNGEYESDFIRIKAFRNNALYIKNYCAKGDLVVVTGAWQHSQYVNNAGVTVYTDDCIVESITRLTPRTDPQQQQYKQPSNFMIDDDKLPF